MEEYKFYMIRYGESEAVWKDLEIDFPGLRYKECTGLNSYGEPTNMYAEDSPYIFAPKPIWKCSNLEKLSAFFIY